MYGYYRYGKGYRLTEAVIFFGGSVIFFRVFDGIFKILIILLILYAGVRLLRFIVKKYSRSKKGL